MEKNFNNAKKDIRALGVKVKVNVMECCRGCITEEKLNLTDTTQPHIYTYGGQDNAVSWVDGLPYWRSALRGRNRWTTPKERDMANTVYFNHGNLTTELGNQIVEILHTNGLAASWNGEEYSCIEVDFQSTKFQMDLIKAEEAINHDYAMC
jgi:hypothetical protein